MGRLSLAGGLVSLAGAGVDLVRAAGLLGIVLASDRAAPVIAWAAEPSAVGEVQDLLQISSGDRRRLVQGEVVSYPVSENSERELAAGMAMLVPAPLRQVADYLASGQLITQDATIVEFGMLASETPAAFLASVRYPAIDLRSAAGDAERLARYGQALAPTLLRYPADPAPQMANSFYWIKR